MRRAIVVLALALIFAPGCGSSEEGSTNGSGGTAGQGGSSGAGGAGASGGGAAGSEGGTGGGGAAGSAGAAGAGGAPPVSACNDGVDNDGDGLVDWQFDLGCANAADDDETAAPRDDEDGFTTFDPPASGLILYVSSSEGDDENDGLTPGSALATIGKATELAGEDGTGAWVLLRRGDTFEENLSITELHGASESDRKVFASYGDETDPPVLLNQSIRAIKTFDNVAIVGIEVSGDARNPDSPNYVSADSPSGLGITASGENLLIENCRFTFGQTTIQASQDGTGLRNVEYRRNVVHKAYSVDSHSQGLYSARVDGLLVEDNVFDHNGWLIQQIDDGNDQEDGQATFFNHNLYLSSVDDLVVRGNLILRAASMGIKMRSDEPGHSTNVTIENNVFFEGEIGVGIGGNTDEPDRFVNSAVLDNVFLHVGRARPTNRTLAWAIDVAGNDGIEVARNLVLRQDDPEVRNSYGLHLGSSTLRDVHVHDNVFYRLNGRGIRVNVGSTFENLVIEDNVVDMEDLDSRVAEHEGAFSAFVYRNNVYWTGRAADEWFRVDGADANLAGWEAASGDTGSSTTVPSYPDPTRTLATYHESLGGASDDEAFIETALGQTRWSWDERYTGEAVRAYVAAGFE